MALEAPSAAPAISEEKLYGAADRDYFHLVINHITHSDGREYCILTHHDHVNEITLTMKFPRSATEAGVLSFKIPFQGKGAYRGKRIFVKFLDLHRQPQPNREIDSWNFKLDDHDVSFERYSSGHIYTTLIPVDELWKFAKDWGISTVMSVQDDAHEDMANMVLARSEEGIRALAEHWPETDI